MNKYLENELDNIRKNNIGGIFSNKNKWKKYSSYKISNNSKGDLIIMPEENSEEMEYNPSDLYPAILVDFLELVVDVFNIVDNNRIDEDFSFPDMYFSPKMIESEKNLLTMVGHKILNFSNNYGLLGIYRETLFNFKNIIFNINDDYLYDLLLNEYRNYNAILEFGNDVVETIDVTEQTKTANNIKQTTDDELHNFKIFLEKYTDNTDKLYKYLNPFDKKLDRKNIEMYIGDSVYSTKQELLKYYNFLDNMIKYKRGNYYEDITNQEAFLEHNSIIDNIGINVDFINKKPRISWRYNSLFTALKIMYLYDLTIGENNIELCARCRRPFIKSVSTKIFCTTECGNAHRKQRERIKEKNLILEKYFGGVSIDELAKKYNKTESQILKWAKETENNN